MRMKEIHEAQKIVTECSPNPYYLKAYREAEISYWGDTLPWLRRKSVVSKNCLDIGSAYGTLSIFSRVINPEMELTVVDCTKYMSNELIDKYNINYIFKNFETEETDIRDKFDIIILTEVFEHFNFNPLPTLEKIKNILSEEGSLFLSTPNAKSWGRLPYFPTWKNMPMPNANTKIIDAHIYQYSLSELKEIFSECGLRIERMNGEDSHHLNFELRRK